MKLKVIITGATGMVGEGVLLECLNRVRRLLLLSGYIIRRHEQQILEVKDIVQLAKV